MRVLPRRMRSAFLLLVTLALATGCLGPDAPTPEAGDAAALPWRSEGAFFIQPPRDDAPTETVVPFLVNRSGADVTVRLAVDARYGPLGLPSTASVEARIEDAAGATLAEGGRPSGGAAAFTVEARGVPRGQARLVLLAYGGSDGEANGDRVAYVIDAA